MVKAAEPKRVRTIAALRQTVTNWRNAGETIAMVPTMGALHAGHLSLVEEAKRRADRILVSIFVNPTQFAPGEDFDAYPRTEEEDCTKLASLGVDLAFIPSAREMYPEGFATRVNLSGPAEGLESDFRPHFFEGVATVVSKLLLAALPDIAIFGEKDFQQLRVIERIVKDLHIPVNIAGAPTMREEDGLAMSSRNTYLSKDERARAVKLITIMRNVAAKLHEGAKLDQSLESGLVALKQAGFKPDYLSLCTSTDLKPVTADTLPCNMHGRCRLLAAAWMGQTRLIDNIEI